jgi:superfamily II DNA or RNA helicase
LRPGGAADVDCGLEHRLFGTFAVESQHFPRLRDYQRDVIARVNAEIAAGRRRVLMVMQTGAGKTMTAAALCADLIAQSHRVLWLTHRRELVNQASRTLYRNGIDAGIILPGFPMRLGEAMQIASIASLHARAIRGGSIDLPEADLVVVDEAHHAPARSWRRLLTEYPKAVIIGLTATPCRGDGRGLGGLFDAMVEGPSVAELIALCHLVRSRIYAPSQPDLTGVRVERGDYVEAQLAERMDRPQLVGDAVAHWFRLNPERRPTIAFGTGVAHSLHLRDEYRRAGVAAEHIDGNTPLEERDAIIAGLSSGAVEVITNSAVLGEGFDAPDVACLVLARPTKSLPLYRQMIGRGLRSAPGKTDCLILDHSGNVFRHGFPDDPVEWSLEPDRRAENKAHSARVNGSRPALVDCPECHAVRFQGQPCPACGWRPQPKPAAVKVVDGELGHVSADRTVTAAALDQRRFYAQLLYIARERGYQRGWAGHKFREKFGYWPSWRSVEPLPPDDAVRAWERSRRIAYAKAQAKQRGAA